MKNYQTFLARLLTTVCFASLMSLSATASVLANPVSAPASTPASTPASAPASTPASAAASTPASAPAPAPVSAPVPATGNVTIGALNNPHVIDSTNPSVDSIGSTNNAESPLLIPTPPDINADGYVLMDVNSGRIIAEKNANKKRPPASLTKLMTLYIAANALKQNQIKIDDTVHISETAWRTGGSRMFVKLGSDVPVKDLINGIIVASGNDACVALSEHIAGSQSAFTNLMNQTAASLGMNNSHFLDATGLPDPNHYSTPYDLALLTRAIIREFPEYYASWFNQKWITWNGVRQPNRNRLLWRDIGVDGLKTGHTEEAGYCLISSAQQNGMRLLSIMMGTPSDTARTDDTQAMLTYGFRFYETHKLYSAGATVDKPRVWMGAKANLPVGFLHDFYVTIPKNTYARMKVTTHMNPNLQAPIAKNQAVGSVEVNLNDKIIATAPLIALEADDTAGLFSRMGDRIVLLFSRWL